MSEVSVPTPAPDPAALARRLRGWAENVGSDHAGYDTLLAAADALEGLGAEVGRLTEYNDCLRLQEGEVARLIGRVHRHNSKPLVLDVAALVKERDALSARLAAAGAVVEACRPFARYAAAVSGGWPDKTTCSLCFWQPDGTLKQEPTVTLGDCRAALRAVRAWEGESHG